MALYSKVLLFFFHSLGISVIEHLKYVFQKFFLGHEGEHTNVYRTYIKTMFLRSLYCFCQSGNLGVFQKLCIFLCIRHDAYIKKGSNFFWQNIFKNKEAQWKNQVQTALSIWKISFYVWFNAMVIAGKSVPLRILAKYNSMWILNIVVIQVIVLWLIIIIAQTSLTKTAGFISKMWSS